MAQGAIRLEKTAAKKAAMKKAKATAGIREKAKQVRLSKSRELESLKKFSGLNDEAIASYLDVTVKTYRNYRAGVTLMKSTIRDRVQILLHLFEHGVDVFGSAEKFKEWLETENFFFGKKPPIEYLKNIRGIDFIDNRLTAMEYGDNV